MEQNEKCIKARLVASKTDGAYEIYVFENLVVASDHQDRFITCTRVPNWHGIKPEKCQEGYLSYKFVRGGLDTYYHKEAEEMRAYLDTKTYFLDFVPITHVLSNGYVIEKGTIRVS